MARNPTYYQTHLAPNRARVRPRRAKKKRTDLALKDPREFSKTLALGFAVAILLGILVMFAGQSFFHGDFGVWGIVQGHMWGVQDLVAYLENQGLDFNVGEPTDTIKSAGPAVQLQFPGYKEAVAQAEEETNMRLRYQRMARAQQFEHAVFVVRYDKNSPQHRLFTTGYGYYGGYYRWGMFVFRGDSREIQKLRELLD